MKIAIILNEMSVGGIPRACVPLMQQLLKHAEVTLIMSTSAGELNSQIPAGVRVVVIPYQRLRSLIHKYKESRSRIKSLVTIIWTTWLGRVLRRWVKNNVYIAKRIGFILNETFDCAVAYHGMNVDHLTRTLYNVKAARKIAWIHGDHPFVGKHLKDIKDLYGKFDGIFFASDICKSKFLRDFPDLGVQTCTSYCMLDTDEIKAKALETKTIEFSTEYINILTVGRLSPEKGQDMIPDVLKILNRSDVRWYLVGDGPDRKRIELLKNNNNAVHMILLGSKNNPYPYIRECDIYVQPSYSEAYSLTAFEAGTLGKPIVITDVAGATELLAPGKDAMVVSSTADAIASAVKSLIDSPELRHTLSANVKSRDFSNYVEINKLISFIN